MVLVDTSLALKLSSKTALVFSLPKTAIPNCIKLTVNEAQELFQLERYYETAICEAIRLHKKFTFNAMEGGFDISSTCNTGIHYFCIQHNIHLEFLAANESISTEIAFLILQYKILEKYPKPSSAYIFYSLLRNPVVYKNAELFKNVFENALGDDDKSDEDKDLLLSLRGCASCFPVESLILLFMEIKKHNSTALLKIYLNIVNSKKAEILTWTSESYPEMDELPFSWIMKAYGFTEGVLND